MYKKISFFCVLMLCTASSLYANPPIVALGSNPVWAVGGNQGTTSGQTISLISAPSDQDLLITDVVLTSTGSPSGSNSCISIVTLQDSNANVLAMYRLASRDNVNYGGGIGPTTVSHTYRSGLPVSAGTTLQMVAYVSCGEMSYSIAGMKVHS